MKIKYLLIIIYLFFAYKGMAQDKSFAQPLSPRTANYDIHLTLDTEKRQVNAQQKLTFTNPSADTIWMMPFHMYYNAFKNNKSTFVKGSMNFVEKSKEDAEEGLWSWVKVLEVLDSSGNNLTDSLHYVAVDDGNPDDHTVLQLRLKVPVLPYQTYTLDMKWRSQIPKIAIRTGYNNDYFFMAQWYPKLGVYEPAGSRFATVGAWNCHQYHATTEYFGEFGVYDVHITVPEKYVVGASGFLVSEKEKVKGKKTYHYKAEDVIDFAWTANPDFVEITEEWRGIDIKLLVMPEHECNQDRFLKAAKHTLAFFEDYIEKYPYPTLTIVSPPCYGLFSGAMEYPTLFTAPTLCILPENIRTTETLTMHELTHQYFMQMLATNEQEEAWMDEGFTAFFEAKMMDMFYPKGVFYWDYMGMNIGSEEFRRGRFFNSDNINAGPMSQFGWHFKHGGQREIFYGKGALTLSTLEGLVGEDCFKKIIKTYFKRWKFKHPCRHDFEAIVNEVVLQEQGEQKRVTVMQFLTQAIYHTTTCDYAVHSISNKKITDRLGFFEDTETPVLPKEEGWKEQYESKTILYRLGDFVVPQDIRITFDNGEVVHEKWDGKASTYDFTYTGKNKIVSVEIDPQFKIALDKNLINNSYTTQPETLGITRYSTSFMTWIQGVLVSISALV